MKPIVLIGSGCTQLLSYTWERPLAEKPPANAVFTLSPAAPSPAPVAPGTLALLCAHLGPGPAQLGDCAHRGPRLLAGGVIAP